jgi:hypothetical protein
MEHVATLLRAIAALGWVIFAFAALLIFRTELTRALGHLRRGKILGQEFELGDQLLVLENSANTLAREVQELPREASQISDASREEELDAAIKPILEQAAASSKVALMMLSAELDKRAFQALAARGILLGRPFVSLRNALNELRQHGLPPNLEGSLELFSSIRNKIIHGFDATEDDALRALDSGMTILRALGALPNEIYVVYHPGVQIFQDTRCTVPFPEGKGIVLETTSPGGVRKSKIICPSTSTHFLKGKRVAWEWNLGKRWPAAWYRDPDTDEIKSAWGASGEFVGRHLDDLSGG